MTQGSRLCKFSFQLSDNLFRLWLNCNLNISSTLHSPDQAQNFIT